VQQPESRRRHLPRPKKLTGASLTRAHRAG
jgi:hypothetical protein